MKFIDDKSKNITKWNRNHFWTRNIFTTLFISILSFIIIATCFSFYLYSSNNKNTARATDDYTVEDFIEFENSIKDLCKDDSFQLSMSNDNYEISSLSLSSFENTSNENKTIENKKVNEFSKFYLKRLIVIGTIEETYGATKIIKGYKDYSILCYDTEGQAKYAYEQLILNKNIEVIIDSVISTNDYADNEYDYSKALTWSNEAMNIGGINDYLQTNGTNEDIVVVVLDTGINISHPLFNDRFIIEDEQIVGYSYTDSTLSNSQYDFEDDNGHGSHVAGIVTNLTPDNVKILPIKVMDSSGYGSFSLLLTALARVEQVYSATYNISCINLSLGGHSDSSTLSSMDTLFQQLRNDNILTVVAAGNDQLDTSNYMPANSDNVITVSSLKKDNNLPVYEFDNSYSNFGASIDISAPGTEIVSAYYTNHYAYMSGTSMAAPHISAAVALLCLDNQYWNNTIPTYTADTIETRLYENVVDLGDKGWDKFYGYGMIDLKYFNVDNSKDILTFKNDQDETLNIETYIEFTDNFNLNVIAADTSYEIYYTTNGTIPNNKTSNLYSSSIEVTNSTIFNFMAFKIVNGNITESSCLYTVDLFNPNDNIDDFFVNEEGTLIKYTGHFANLEIPNVVDGIEVLSLGARLFSDNEIVNITLPDSCTKIGVYCFSNCENLESIEYNQVNTIDAYAFEYCSSLTQINLHKVQILGAKLENFDINGHTFENCTSLSNIYLPKLTTIGENTFKNSSVNKVVIGYSFNTCYGEAIDSNITIYGYAGSGAEQYATLYGNEFIAIRALSIESDLISTKEVQQNTKDRLTISVTGYEQTYQWYKTNDTIANGELLTKETLNYLQLDTSNLGTTNYFVKVTDWDGSYIYSHICSVSIIENTNTSVAQIYSETDGWTYYTTLESAISNSVDDDVIVITQDCYITDYLIIDKNLTLVTNNNATIYIDENLIADSRTNSQSIFTINRPLTLGSEQTTYQDLTLSTLFIDGQADKGSFDNLFDIVSTSLSMYDNVQIQNCCLDKLVWGRRNTSFNMYGGTFCDNITDWVSYANQFLIAGYYFNIFIGSNAKFINNQISSDYGSLISVDSCKLEIADGAIFTKNKFSHIIYSYCDATINILGGKFTENICDTLINYSVADDTKETKYENKLYLNGGISLKNTPLSLYTSYYDVYIIDSIASFSGGLTQLKSCIEIGQNCLFNSFHYNNINTNFNILITENLSDNQYFTFDIENATPYTETSSDNPILIFDSGINISLDKFQSKNYNFISGKQVNGQTYVYLEEKPTYEFKYVITKDYSVTQIYNYGDTITKIEDPVLEGYEFMGWYKESSCINLYTFSTMPSHYVTVYAKWEPLEFSITASAGENGAISPSGITSITYGESQTFTFIPNEGYKVADIQIDGISLTDIDFTNAVNNGYTFSNVNKAHTIHVEFKVGTYTITATAGENGAISPSGKNTYNYGESQKFVITANDGYLVERIVVDGKFLVGDALTSAINNGYTFENINADHTINVQFEENNYVALVSEPTGNTTYYTTLESAINNAPAGSLVVILKSCDISQTIVITKQIAIGISDKVSHITINKKTDDYLFKITNSGQLDIYDTITITGNNNKTYATKPIFYNEGILNIRTETFIIENTNCLNAIIVNKNEMLMKGGIIQNNTGNAILNNGTLSLKYSVQISNNSGYGIYSNGTLKITDGSITGNAEQDLIIDNSILDIGGNFSANKIKIDNNSYISVSSNLTNEEQLFVLDLSDYTCYQLDSANPLVTFAEGLTVEKSKFSLFNRFYELKQGTQTTTTNNLYVNELEAYYITYNLNYTNSTSITQKYLENDSIILPEDPHREGYQFKGWYLESDCINSFNVTAMPANDLTAYAKWEINKYKITATSGQNGNITPSGDIQVEFGGSQTFTFVANEGYEVSEILIDGIALSSTELELARNNGYTFTAVNKTHTIHVEFDLKLYSITYELERYHQENIVQYYHMGETIILPETPFKDYYHYFSGWYDNNMGLGSKYEFSTMPAENIVVYGLFTLRHYYISATYNEYGTVSPIEKDIVFPDSAIFNLTPNDGYTILDIKVDGNSIANEELIKARATNTFTFYLSKYGYKLKDNSKSENHTIYFEFSPIPYTITFNQNYTGAENTTKEFPTGANIVLIDNPTRIGHTFKGWYNEQECLTEFTLTTMPAYDLTVYAKWEINTYTLTATAGPNGTISPSGDIQVEFGGSQTFVASANEGYQISKIIVDNIELSEDEFTNSTNHTYAFLNIDDNHTIEVYFSLKTYTILYNLNYEGAENFSQSYEYTSNIELPASPTRKGYSFDGWYNEQECLTEFVLTTMPAYNLTVYAKWEINTYTITATAGPNGTISPSGEISAEYGSNIKFKFTPNTGHHVSLIKVDGTDLTGSDFTNAIENGYEFKNIEDNHTIYVEFEINTYTITAESNSYGSISPKGTNTYNYGESQTFVITVNEGYHIALVKIDDNNLEESEFEEIAKNGYTFSNITNNHTIYVEFEINTYTITATAGPNGNITPSGDIQVEFGGSQTFTFTPNAGHHISKIQVDNRDLSEDEFTNAIENGYEFKNIEDNHTIYVEFEINTYTITATSGQNGNITPSGDIQVEFGESQTFTFVANEGYEVSEILIDGTALSSTELELAKNNGYTFTNINCDHSIYVKFEKSTFTLTYKMNYDCEDITQDFIFQANIVLIDNPIRIGHTFKGWYNEQECLTEFVLTTMPAYNLTVYAKWEINTYTITATAGPNGTISPSGEISAEYGSNIKFKFTPNTGHHVSLIKVDGTDLTGSDFTNAIENGYTFTNVNEIHNILVEFEINRYKITLSVEGDGEFYSEQELSNISHGEDRLFIIETDFDKYRVEIYINNSFISTTNKELKIENIDENIKIEVKFIKKSFFETKVGIITIISSCIGILLIALSIPIVKRIKRNRMYDRMSKY